MKKNTIQQSLRKFVYASIILFGLNTMSSCTSMSVNDHIQPESLNGITLPDGIVANIVLFPNWKQAGAYLKEIKPKDKVTYYDFDKVSLRGPLSFSPDVSVDTEGYLRKTWVGTDSKVSALYNKMVHGKYRFAIGGIQTKNEWQQIMITCKNGNLTYDRQGYVDKNSELYISHRGGSRKQESKNALTSNSSRSRSSNSSKSNNRNTSSNENFQMELYRLRHKTYQASNIGGGGRIEHLKYRFIYYDNARRELEYVVDLDGNIRTLHGNVSSFDLNERYPIVPYYSIPKATREAALKSLE